MTDIEVEVQASEEICLRTLNKSHKESSFSLRNRKGFIERFSWLESGADDIYFPPTFLAGLSRGKEKIMKLKILKGLENLRGMKDFWLLGIVGPLAF